MAEEQVGGVLYGDGPVVVRWDVMNGADDTARRQPDGDGESWELPTSMPEESDTGSTGEKTDAIASTGSVVMSPRIADNLAMVTVWS